MMARIDEETLNRHIEENERQIMRLQAEMSEASQIKQMIEMTASMLADMGGSWQSQATRINKHLCKPCFPRLCLT
jgi:hypothetical protein